MKILFRIVAAILFVIFFGFALKNTQIVSLRLFFGYEITGPLVFLLLSFFCAGAVLGILAMIPTLFRYRRELAKQRKAVAAMEKENEAKRAAGLQPPLPDGVVNQ